MTICEQNTVGAWIVQKNRIQLSLCLLRYRKQLLLHSLGSIQKSRAQKIEILINIVLCDFHTFHTVGNSQTAILQYSIGRHIMDCYSDIALVTHIRPIITGYCIRCEFPEMQYDILLERFIFASH